VDYVQEEIQERPFDAKLLRRIYRFVVPYKRALIIATVAVLAMSALQAINPLIMRTAIDGYLAVAEPRPWMVVILALCMVGVLLVEGIADRISMKKGAFLEQRVVRDVRQHIFSHLQDLSLNYYDTTKEGQIIARADSDATRLEWVLAWSAISVLQAVLNLALAAGLMLYLSPRLFAATFVVLPALFVVTFVLGKKLKDVYRKVREATGKITANLAENINGIRVVQAFNRQDRNLSEFDGLNRDNFNKEIRAAKLHVAYRGAMDVIGVAGIIIIFGYGGYLVMNARLQVGVLIAFLMYLRQFFGPVGWLVEIYNGMLAAMAAAERIFALLDTEPQVKDPPDAVDLPQLAGKVEFQNVWFAYEGENWVVRDINFTAEPGRTYALVGPTGAGKTTLVSLAARFYDPDRGKVLVDGYDLSRATQRSLHKQTGTVLQTPFLFSGTVLDNIRFGRPEATDEEGIEAAKALGAHEVISRLRDGYRTQVHERGEGLSLGERQLICFTRALLRDPRILILDEATSNVDTETEHRLQYALMRLTSRRTSFIVAHRLSTIRHADLVLVLQDGRIVEKGTHDQLLHAGGLYADMYLEFVRGTMPNEA